MSKLVEVGSLKFGDWFVSTKGQRGMYLGQAVYCPFEEAYYVSVWVDTGEDGLWGYQIWNADYNVTPLPDCTGPDWVAPEPLPEIAVDTPVWVRDCVSQSWQTSHFAEWTPDGLIRTYWSGCTSHNSSKAWSDLNTWNYYSLTDPNKEPEDE